MRALAIAFASLIAVPAQAWQSNPAEARRHFQHGNASSAAGRYADALASYRESYRQMPRPNVLFNIARCEELLGDHEAAFLDYQRFLEQAEAANPLRADARAKIDEIAPRIAVVVPVASIPPDAEVFVDGAAAAAAHTPAILRLRAGSHRLRLQAPGAEPKEVTVDARPGAAAPVDVVLARLAHLEITTEPSDARIRRIDGDGTAVGRLAADVPAGRHRFSIDGAGYSATEVELVAAAGETVRQRVTLRKQEGVLLVRSNVAGAGVSLDGVPTGLTPTAPDALRLPLGEGVHEVIVERPGLRSWRGQVHAAAGRTFVMDVRLLPERSRAARIATWSLGGAGAAATLAGCIFGVLAIEDRLEYDRSHSSDVADRLNSRATAADVLLGVGVASLAVAAIVHLYSRGASEAKLAEP